MVANIKVLISFIKDKVVLERKREWCLVGRYNEDLVAAIVTNFKLETRKLSENEALQRTIIFHSLPSITPNLTNVMNATNLRDNLILYLDNQDEYRLSRPPPNFFVDLKNMPIEDWREKYMLARDKMKVPCLLLSLSDVSVLYHIDQEYKMRVIDHFSVNVQSIQAVSHKMLFPLTSNFVQSLEKMIKMASVGDKEKVNIRWKDIIKNMKSEGYYNFPKSTLSFKLGQLSSNNTSDTKKSYSKEDLASGTLEFMAHIIAKTVLAHARAFDVNQIYACGDVFSHIYFREIFERLSLCYSLEFFIQGNKLLRTHVLQTPCYLTALGAWLADSNSSN